MERVIDCPICFDQDSCFEDIQEKFKSYICFNCGFMSSTFYTEDNVERAKLLQDTSRLIKDLEFFDDERQIYWYPSVVNMGPKGIIYPEGNIEHWVWKYAKVVEVPEEEQQNYPVLSEDGEFYTEKLDTENAETYGQYEFLEACKKMGITKEIRNG
jgi:hypothetical protein